MEQEPKAESWHYPFKKGDVVRVKRSSGEIEDGWMVHEFYEPLGKITVRKGSLEKTITLEALKELNES